MIHGLPALAVARPCVLWCWVMTPADSRPRMRRGPDASLGINAINDICGGTCETIGDLNRSLRLDLASVKNEKTSFAP